jgi:nitrate/nitrite transporter NarK
MAATQPPSAAVPTAPQDPSPEQPLSQLISRMTSDVSTLFRKEVELAKIEVKDEVRQTAKAGAMYGGAGFAGYLAAVMISFAIALLLDLTMATWLAFLIVGIIYAIVAYVLFKQGQQRAKRINPVPEQTVETIKEDIEWVKTRKT